MRNRLASGLLMAAVILCGVSCALDEAKDVGFFDRAVRKDNRQMLEVEPCRQGEHIATKAECAEARRNRHIEDCSTYCVKDN
jgi:hypothetical protein